MLINCPRCGFQQPKDKYCAQCGVDMETFRPAAPPAWKKFFGNPLIQLSLLALVAGGVSITLYQKGQQSLERRVSYLKSTVQINQGAQNLPPAEVSQLDELPSASEQASQNPDTDASDGTITATKVTAAAPAGKPEGDSLAASATATPGKEGRALAKTTGPRLVVYYAEVGRGTLNRIVNDSRSTGQYMNFNDYSAGILPSISRAITSPQILILHKEERTVDSTKTLQWSYGLKDRRDPSIEIGLTTFFEISEMEGNNLRGNMEIQRTWREMNPSGGFEIQRKSFPAIFEIGNDSGFFMAGVMPTQSNLENEQELTAIDIYKILRSPRFREGNSEFVIFVEFAKGN